MTWLMLLAATIGQTPPSQATPAPQSRQQRFDAASAAVEAGKCAEAVAGFDALQKSAIKPNPVVDAITALRRGRCELELRRDTAGEASIRNGINALGGNPAFAGDVRTARLALAQHYLRGFDYTAAEREAEAMLAGSTGALRIAPLMLLTQARMFDDTDAAIKTGAESVELAVATAPNDKSGIASVRTLYGRALLNRNRKSEALEELRKALALQGGLDRSVGVADLATRSDLALTALLSGKDDLARQYLAYTGAARMKKLPFASAKVLDLPPCGDETGLSPDDVAVVELQIDPDGGVGSVTPIWSTGDRAKTLAVARAADGWSWVPADIADVHPVYKAATRIEVRCSLAADRPGPSDALDALVDDWLNSKGLPRIEAERYGAREIAQARAALAPLPAADPRRVAPLIVIGKSILTPEDERQAKFSEALQIARAQAAPVGVQTAIELWQLATIAADDADRRRSAFLAARIADPRIVADAQTSAALRLLSARDPNMGAEARAVQVNAVADDARLAKDDPLRVAALLERASLLARAGDTAGARAAFDATGLTEQQCAVMGLRPAMRRSGASAADYPMEALRWGFEGWSRVEFDVAADGRTLNQRAVLSYPPMIFGKAASGMMADARFESSFRPEGGAACTGSSQNVVFRMPR